MKLCFDGWASAAKVVIALLHKYVVFGMSKNTYSRIDSDAEAGLPDIVEGT
jgi:hypothetical protein